MHGARCGDHVPCGGGYQQWSNVDRIVSAILHQQYLGYRFSLLHTHTFSLSTSLLLPLPRQLVGLVLVLLAQSIQTPLSLDLVPNNQCSVDSTSQLSYHPCSANITSSVLGVDTSPQDFTNVQLLNTCLAFVMFAIFLFLFWPKYKRRDSEMAAEQLAKQNASNYASGSEPTKPDVITSVAN